VPTTDYIDPKWSVNDVATFLQSKGIKNDWVVKEMVDRIAFQTLDIILLHEKWKVGPYGTCVMRQQSLSYWGVGEIPPSEKIVAKASLPNATEIVDRVIANRT